MTGKLQEILAARETEYGDFVPLATFSQSLKGRFTDQQKNAMESRYSEEFLYVKEGREMILHKLARLANGNPNHIDSWRDIAGYATLVADALEAGKE